MHCVSWRTCRMSLSNGFVNGCFCTLVAAATIGDTRGTCSTLKQGYARVRRLLTASTLPLSLLAYSTCIYVHTVQYPHLGYVASRGCRHRPGRHQYLLVISCKLGLSDPRPKTQDPRPHTEYSVSFSHLSEILTLVCPDSQAAICTAFIGNARITCAEQCIARNVEAHYSSTAPSRTSILLPSTYSLVGK